MSDITKILTDSYQYFKDPKHNLLAANGRPLCDSDETDLDKDGDLKEKVTYSQGISATLLRAAAMDDRATFDRSWKWAKANMQRLNINQTYNPGTGIWSPFPSVKKDHLFASRYLPGLRGKDGGILNNSDFDSSADTDQDIAAALLIAARKWGSAGTVNYRQEAQLVLNDIWDKETIIVAGKRVLIGGDAQRSTRDPLTGRPTVGINPSYLRPTYYESLFAPADRSHDWRSLVATSYEVIAKSSDATLHNQSGSPIDGKINLPPNWVSLDSGFNVRDHGFLAGDHARNDYYAGGDSFRLLFWMSAQAQVNPLDQTAQRFLLDQTGARTDLGPRSFLTNEMAKHQTIFNDYLINGNVLWRTETLQSLAMDMVYFHAAGDTKNAQRILNKVMSAYDRKEGYWRTANPQDNYAAQNWVWLGLFVLANGSDKLFGSTTAPASTAPYRVAQSAHPFQVDTAIGFQTEDKTPIINKEQLENLSLQQLEETARAIAAQPFLIGGAGPNNVDQFPVLAKLDKKYDHKLTPFLINPGAYWNNAIQILTVYIQKCIELDDQPRISAAIKLCEQFERLIARQALVNKFFIPAEYFEALLSLASTELKIQTRKSALEKEIAGQLTAKGALSASDSAATRKQRTLVAEKQYFLDARKTVLKTIDDLMHPKDTFASKPDYFSVTKALLILGDLNIKLKEVNRQQIALLRHQATRNSSPSIGSQIDQLEKENVDLVNSAFALYDALSVVDVNVALTNFDLVGINLAKIEFTADQVRQAVKANLNKGHIDRKGEREALKGVFHYLKAGAMLKKAALVSQILGADPANYPKRLREKINGATLEVRTEQKINYVKNLITSFGSSYTELKPLDLCRAAQKELASSHLVSGKVLNGIIGNLKNVFPPFHPAHARLTAFVNPLRGFTAKAGKVLSAGDQQTLSATLTAVENEINAALRNEAGTVFVELKLGAKKTKDFFFSYGTIVKADLLLAYADLYKFSLNLPAERGKLFESDEYVLYAENLYNDDEIYSNKYGTGHPFRYLHAWAVVKKSEIVLRFARHINTAESGQKVSQSSVINWLTSVQKELDESDYLLAELTHLKTVFFISRCTKSRVEKLGGQGGRTIRRRTADDRDIAYGLTRQLRELAYYLDEPQMIFYLTWADLKEAESWSRRGNHQRTLGLSETGAQVVTTGLYAQIEGKLRSRLMPFKERLMLREHSIFAELYFEWAISWLSKQLAGKGRAALMQSLPYSEKSDNKFDYQFRVNWIKRALGIETGVDINLEEMMGSVMEDFGSLDTSSLSNDFDSQLGGE